MPDSEGRQKVQNLWLIRIEDFQFFRIIIPALQSATFYLNFICQKMMGGTDQILFFWFIHRTTRDEGCKSLRDTFEHVLCNAMSSLKSNENKKKD